MTTADHDSLASKLHLSSSFCAKYQPVSLLGHGSFGQVLLCTDKNTGVRRACKVIQKAALQSKESKAAVAREVAALRALRGHVDGVVHLVEVIESHDVVQMVMELCCGGSLCDAVATHGKLAESGARHVLTQVATTLRACHERGIIHRDIKPENLLFVSSPDALFAAPAAPAVADVDVEAAAAAAAAVQVKLADFGLAVILGICDRVSGRAGSPHYWAPEVAAGKEYGRAADVWSLGVVLCRMLTNTLPFKGKDERATRNAVCLGRVDFHGPEWAGVSEDAKDLVKKMLVKDPAKRIKAEKILVHPWCASPPPLSAGAGVKESVGQGARERVLCTRMGKESGRAHGGSGSHGGVAASGGLVPEAGVDCGVPGTGDRCAARMAGGGGSACVHSDAPPCSNSTLMGPQPLLFSRLREHCH